MDAVITLIKTEITGRDAYGNEVTEQTERDVFCQVFGVSRSEFYSAATAGMHPDLTVRLSDFMDYEGEELARYEGALYSIIRTYRDRGAMGHGRATQWSGMDPNAIELTLQKKIGVEV